jgi:uncharacterized protein YndB with AHSA1/START domain
LNDQLIREHTMKLLALTLSVLFSASLSAQNSPVPAATDESLVIEVFVPASPSEVWKAFTTQQGLSTWLAPDVTVDLRPGGDWMVHFPGSTGGGTILSFVPEKELVISALAPDRFPNVRAARTRADFSLRPLGAGTLVRLTQTGWRSGSEWDRAYEYLTAGNAELLATLHRRFVDGPIDWKKEMDTPAPKSTAAPGK